MRRLAVVLSAAIALTATALGVGSPPTGAAVPAATTASIADSHPSWASPAAKVGEANTADRMQFRVYLALNNQAAAEAAAQSVSDPASSGYKGYLAPAQVLSSFGPSPASVTAVSTWLSGAGFALSPLPANQLFVEATGTVAQVEKAFGVDLGVYAVKGHRLRGPDHDLSVPAAIAPVVTGVVGADQSMNLMTPNHIGADPGSQGASPSLRPAASPATVAPPGGFRNGRPCSTYWNQKSTGNSLPKYNNYPKDLPYAPCGYTPPQLRAAYGIGNLSQRGLDGRGTTVAVVDAFAAPTIYQDASQYAQRNDPGNPLRPNQFSQLVFPTNGDLEGPDGCDASGWYGEETLDVEAVHGMAPGANILYVGGSDCQDVSLDKALNAVVAGRLATIVTNSYGDAGEDIPRSEVRAFQTIAIEGVLEGIGIYFSSGDSGDEVADLGFPSADFSASSPWVTAVGGTSLGIDRQGNRVVETGWETDKASFDPTTRTWTSLGYLYGSGGGTSVLFNEPWYQRGVVPDNLARNNQNGQGRGRVVPDISMLGDPNTGMLIGETQTFSDGVYYDEYRIGGTSLSSPLMAGLMAVSDQAAGFSHGFINPALYSWFGRSGIQDVTHVKAADVRVDFANGENAADGLLTSIREFDDQSLAIRTKPGYDDVTGLGSPAGARFLLTL